MMSIKRKRDVDLGLEGHPAIKKRKLCNNDEETVTSSTSSRSSNSKQEQTLELRLYNYPYHQQWPIINISSAYWSVHKLKIVENKIGIIKYRESGNNYFEVNIIDSDGNGNENCNFKVNGCITSLDNIQFDDKLNTTIIAYDASFIELYRNDGQTFKKEIFGVHKFDKDLVSIKLKEASLELFTKRGRVYSGNINVSTFGDSNSSRYLPCSYQALRFSSFSMFVCFFLYMNTNEKYKCNNFIYIIHIYRSNDQLLFIE